MKSTYTVDDCAVLHSVLRDIRGAIDAYTFFSEVMSTATQVLYVRELGVGELERLIEGWLYRNFHRKADLMCEFIFQTDLENVALYINNAELKLYVQWRLKINK
jgi:hypothetical protein